MEEKREALVPKRLFFHMLFNRHFRQRSTVGTTVAPDSPLLDPLFLHIRLTAGRTDEHAFFIEHSSLFLHGFLSVRPGEDGTSGERIARLRKPNVLPPTRQKDSLLDCERADHYDAVMHWRFSTWLVLSAVITGGLVADDRWVVRAAGAELASIHTPSGTTIKAEIADTPLKRSVGLMYRDHLKKDHGMLFFFSQPQAWTFWMKNTKIALDLIWIDGKQRVTHIERNVPICTKSDDSCPQYRPNSDDAMYVLEIAGGTVDGYKIEKGSKLQFGQP